MLMSMPEKNRVWKYSITCITVEARVEHSRNPEEEDKYNSGDMTGDQRNLPKVAKLFFFFLRWLSFEPYLEK